MSTTEVDNRNRAQAAVPAHGVRTFVIVSCGQFVALTGVTLFNFAAAFYFYGTYSLLVVGFVYALPFVVLVGASPIAGALIDRWGVRRALLASNVGGIVLVATLAVVPFTHTLAVWHAFVVVMVVPLLKALLLPAFEASVPLLVPKQHIGRANGMRMFMNGIGAVLGPIAAVLLLEVIGLYGVGLLVFSSLAVGVLTLVPVRIPRARRDDAAGIGMPALVAEAKQGWHYLRARPGLPALLVFFGVTSFGIGFVEVILPRLVSAFASPTALDVVFVAAVVGMAGTGVAMTIWGGPRRRVRGMLGYSLLLAGAMVIGSLRPNIPLIAAAAAVFLGSTSIIVGNIQTILCTKVEPQLLGRVMGWKNSVYGGLLQLGDILAGLSGGLVAPLIGADHVRSRVLVAVVGDGAGRGFAVLMLAMGLLLAVCVVIAHRHRRLRELEDVLPDVTPADVALASAGR